VADMKILLFSHVLLYPILTGRELRIYHVWRLMARRHEVHLVCQTPEQPDPETKKHLDDIFASTTYYPYLPLPSGGRRSILNILKETLNPPIEHYSLSAFDDTVRVAIEEKVASEKIEAVYTYGLAARRYVENLRGPAVVSDIGDDPTVLHYRLMREKKGLVNKLRGLKDWLAARNFEKKELSRFKNVVMISFDDAKVHRRLCPGNSITILPNGVDSDFFRGDIGSKGEAPTLMFSGVMNYEPNITAAVYFSRDVFPLIKKAIPETHLLIVGRYPTDLVNALDDSDTGITVTGEVPDIRAYFDKTQVYVCPLRSGAGIKNKILESWAMATPVVATSLSCEGIEVAPGEDILVADTPEQFARQTIALLKDRSLREKLALNGRKKVEESYSWETRCDILEETFKKLLTGG
jgi:glycosyltransferase involved in cell wall biosynthesis